MMKMISWNVNGLRAAMGKGFMDFFRQQDADIFCLQETKLSFRRDRYSWICRVIISIGIMLKRRDIPVLRYLLKESP